MKKRIRVTVLKMIVLMLIFFVGIVGTVFFLTLEATDDKSAMNVPTLPEVMMEVNGKTLNLMYGYKQRMQVDFTRDSLTPVDQNQSITVCVDPHGQTIKSISYEVRTSDGSTVLENKKLKKLEEVNGYYKVSATVGCTLRRSQEYSLQISLETNLGSVYYYTRIIQRSTLETVENYLTFARRFSEISTDKENSGELYDYLETEVSYSDTNYSNISITSSWSEVTFGDMNVTLAQRGVPTLKEINETTGSVTMKYQVYTENEQGEKEYYDVTDFFRLRDTELGVVLLNFDRSMEQIFDGSLPVVAENGLVLGIRDSSINYMMNEELSVIAFVQQGDLWTYTPENDKFVRVFTFRKDKNSETRDSRVEHDMKLIRVTQEGDVDFALYGYMNRGAHEGYSGISVCHYDSVENVVEEKVFIPCTQSFEFLKANIGTLSYVNSENELFLFFAGKLYKVNLEKRTYAIMDEGIEMGGFFASESNAHAAWMVTNQDGEGRLKEIDFDTGEIRLIKPGKDEVLQVLGFFNEDLIYGVGSKEDLLLDVRGNEVQAMSRVLIEDFSGDVKKMYAPGYLMIHPSLSSTILELELVEHDSGVGYNSIRKENIMNSQKVAASMVGVELVTYERRGVLVLLALPGWTGKEAPFTLMAKSRLSDKVEIPLDTRVPDGEFYYVYAKGDLQGTYLNAAQAVEAANAQMGVVLNRDQQYVWERGNRKTSIQLTLENCPQCLLTGSLDSKVIQEGLGNTGEVLDLTGCSLDTILYFVSEQKPVVVKTGKKDARVIVGYDTYNLWLYKPSTGETTVYGMEECEEAFEKNSNIFITYMDAY